MSRSSLFAIVLAAGRGERFGGTKQLALYRDTPLVAHAVRLAETVCGQRVLLITGSEHAEVAAAAAPLAGYFTVHERFADGLATSLGVGVRCVHDVADAVMVLLADQPLVTIDHLATITASWRARPDAIVASHYAGKDGPPVIFPRALFDELQALEGDRGARPVIAANEERVIRVAFEPAARDIDRPADLDAL